METRIKEDYGNAENFLLAFNPEKQLSMSDREEAIFGNFPTVQEVCAAYGAGIAKSFVYAQIAELALFANCTCMTKNQIKELASIIVNECQSKKVSEVLHFFYCIKSGKYPSINGKISPMAIMYYLRQFQSECNNFIRFVEKEHFKKVFLIVDDQPRTKVYARVFMTKESAEKALEERDERTGERIYPDCHIIERIIE